MNNVKESAGLDRCVSSLRTGLLWVPKTISFSVCSLLRFLLQTYFLILYLFHYLWNGCMDDI
jgi:hypothetical protein